MSWITKVALKKRWLTILIASLVAGASIWATITLKMELIPDIDLPMTTVITVYPRGQPEEVMDKVTTPIEEAISGIAGLKHITSTSAEGRSTVFAQFEYGTDMDRVNDIIAQNLDRLSLPPEVPSTIPQLGENPRLFPIDLNLMPVVIVSLNGDIPVNELQQIAVTQIVPQLEAIDGVLSVSVEGGAADKILVSPDIGRMNQFGISIGQLAGVLATQEYDSLGDVENALLSPAGPQLRDIAEVNLGPVPGTAITRTNGKTSVNINVTKEAKANMVTTANSVLDKADEIEATLPAGLGLVTILDQSEFIEDSISDLTNNALIGSTLAIVVVFLFLMAFRASLVTAVSIPLSLLIGFLVMRFTNITINIVTLSAMVIAVGRVIDNSIVILEVVYRHLQQGEGFINAAMNGVKEVVTPITSATIVTIVIFIPLIFVGGMVGEMFVPFALTITYALIGSLLVALTVVPALSGYLVTKKSERRVRTSWYLRIYTAMLKWGLKHRVITVVIAIVLFLGSFALLPTIGTSFMPEMNINMLTVEIEMPAGTDLATMEEVVIKVEEVLGDNADVLTYSSTTGPAGPQAVVFAAMFGGGGSNTAQIEVSIAPDADAKETAEILHRELDGVTEVGTISISTVQAMSAQMMSGLEISVRGESYEDVALAASQLLSELKSAGEDIEVEPSGRPLIDRRRAAEREALSHIADLEVEIADLEPTLVIEPDLPKVMALGLSMEQLQQEFYLMRQGGTVVQASLEGIPHEIFVERIVKNVASIEQAKGILVGWPTPIALGDIATVEFVEQATSIQRFDQKLSASITGTITQENVGAVNQAVQSRIDSLDLPPGVEITMGGITEEMQTSFQDMFIAIGIAIVLAYAVLVISFRGFGNPLIIMVSMPLASIGALIALLITGHTLAVTGLMGILMLVGIVLTNAVVLIAVVEQLRKGGMNPYEALVTGGQTRLRPILMTALTTMIAMLPVAFGAGEGVLMAAELATVVIGGLFSSTVLTLLVIPAIYALAKRIQNE